MIVVCVFIAVFMLFVFFFKQKTAYEMRISDWSSDVCSSDLSKAHQIRSARTGIAYIVKHCLFRGGGKRTVLAKMFESHAIFFNVDGTVSEHCRMIVGI